MADLIDITYFTGYRAIPNLSRPEKSELLESDITRLQDRFLREQFGYGFQKDMMANPMVDKYAIILNGGEYTDIYGYVQKFDGIKDIIADYVYYYHVTENYISLSGAGYQAGTNENSVNVQPLTQPTKVYNMMADKLKELEKLIYTNWDNYSELIEWQKICFANEFGI